VKAITSPGGKQAEAQDVREPAQPPPAVTFIGRPGQRLRFRNSETQPVTRTS